MGEERVDDGEPPPIDRRVEIADAELFGGDAERCQQPAERGRAIVGGGLRGGAGGSDERKGAPQRARGSVDYGVATAPGKLSEPQATASR